MSNRIEYLPTITPIMGASTAVHTEMSGTASELISRVTSRRCSTDESGTRPSWPFGYGAVSACPLRLVQGPVCCLDQREKRRVIPGSGRRASRADRHLARNGRRAMRKIQGLHGANDLFREQLEPVIRSLGQNDNKLLAPETRGK